MRKKFNRQQRMIFVLLGLITIFLFTGFYRQYNAIWTELFTFMMFFLALVGMYMSYENDKTE